MRRAFLLPLVFGPLVLGATAAVPQDAPDEDGASGLAGLLERTLSSDQMQVRVEGLTGALSSAAQIDRLTFSDDDGDWLVIEEAVLDWNRLALLRGRVDVNRLEAARLTLNRLPAASEAETQEAPDAQAPSEPFSLPELPVSIEVDTFAVPEITLGESILGEQVVATLDGGLQLAGGNADISVNLQRTDVTGTSATLDAGFSNETSDLSVDLALVAREDGLIVRKLGLPDAPGLDLTVAGAGPLSDFVAEIALRSDNAVRLGGTVALLRDADGPQEIIGDLSGDIRPLITDEIESFFGSETALRFTTLLNDDGSVHVPSLRIAAEAFNIAGRARIGGNGWPELIAVAGVMGRADGEDVRLPASGPPLTLNRARISVHFDATQNSVWSLVLSTTDLQQEAFALGSADIRGAGTLVLPSEDTKGGVDGQILVGASDIDLRDAALNEAVGPEARISGGLSWRLGAGMDVSDLQIAVAGAEFGYNGRLENLETNLEANGVISAAISDLSRYADLAGQEMSGRLDATAEGSVTLLTGMFDVMLDASGEDLVTGIPTVDDVLLGTADVSLSAARSRDGVELREISAETPAMSVNAQGSGTGSETELTAQLALDDLGRIVPEFPGPATLSANVSQLPEGFAVSFDGQAPGDVTFDGDGEVSSDLSEVRFAVETGANLALLNPILSQLDALPGDPLAGVVELTAEGDVNLKTSAFDVTLEGSGRDLVTGIPTADSLVLGSAEIAVSAALTDEGLLIRNLAAETPAVSLTAEGTGTERQADLTAQLQLDNLARVVPDFPGPADLSADVRQGAGGYTVRFDGQGPGDITFGGGGDVASDFSTLDLTVATTATLALLNPILNPLAASGQVAADLRVSGPPELSSVSGDITLNGARFAETQTGIALEDLNAQVSLANSAAQIDLSGQGNRGGSLGVNGGVTLTAPLSSDIAVTLQEFVVELPGVLTTSVNADLGLNGTLPSSAVLAGQISLGPTEIRIPDGGAPDAITEGIVHVGDSPAARQTRDFAGLGPEDTPPAPPSGGGSGGIGLDLDILANNRVFVRGFGLDAELAGEVAVAGTTNDPRPVGEIELVRGRFAFLGQRLDLSEGRIQLLANLIPELFFTAESSTDDADITLTVFGPANEPELEITSNPPLPEDEALAQLLFGQGINELSGFQALQLANAVVALRSGNGLGLVNQLREETGLDDLDLLSDEEGSASVRVGKYITEDIYTNVDIGGRGQTDLSINIDLTNSVTARGTVSNDGNDSIGMFFERDY